MHVAKTKLGSCTIRRDAGDSTELVKIATDLLPQWLELFARKNKDYGSGASFELGTKGQYSDIHRKMIKLKRALWDDQELEFEGVKEVINDLIGHLFLTMYMLETKEDSERDYAFSIGDEQFVERFIKGVGGRVAAYKLALGMDGEAAAKVVEATRCKCWSSPDNAEGPLPGCPHHDDEPVQSTVGMSTTIESTITPEALNMLTGRAVYVSPVANPEFEMWRRRKLEQYEQDVTPSITELVDGEIVDVVTIPVDLLRRMSK